MGMWQRTAIRVSVSALVLALLVPIIIGQFHRNPRLSTTIWGACCLFTVGYVLVGKYRRSRRGEPEPESPTWWGYSTPPRYRWITTAFFLLLGLGLLMWSFKL